MRRHKQPDVFTLPNAFTKADLGGGQPELRRRVDSCSLIVATRTAAMRRKPGVQGGWDEPLGRVGSGPSPTRAPMTPSRRKRRPFAALLSNRSNRLAADIR